MIHHFTVPFREVVDEEAIVYNSTSYQVSGKIRDAQKNKIPFMVVLGDKEIEAKTVTVRTREGENKFNVEPEKFLKELLSKISDKS